LFCAALFRNVSHMSEKTHEQISVKLPVELMQAVQRMAEADHRTPGQMIRHMVATAIKQQQSSAAA
jgi:predicted transcriptional regulator